MIKILILHGPNTNLLGVWGAKYKKNVTLDKVNREIRKYIREKEIDIKIIQSNNEDKAVSYIQKNRKKIDGLIITPGPWQQSGYIICDLLDLLQIPFITISYKKNEKINLLNGIENLNNEDIYSSFTNAIDKMLEIQTNAKK